MERKINACSAKIDDTAAVAELKAISRNAQLWLMDRIGNRLCGVTYHADLGNPGRVQEAVDGLMADMQKIGLFELRMLGSASRKEAV